MNEEELIKYLASMPHSSLVRHCIYLEDENKKYKEQKYITDFIIENGIICKKNKEIDNLQSNWNSLREWVEKQREHYRYFKDNRYRKFLSELLDKMNELEGDK